VVNSGAYAGVRRHDGDGRSADVRQRRHRRQLVLLLATPRRSAHDRSTADRDTHTRVDTRQVPAARRRDHGRKVGGDLACGGCRSPCFSVPVKTSCNKTRTKTKTAEFRSRDQDRGLEDYTSAFSVLLRSFSVSRCCCTHISPVPFPSLHSSFLPPLSSATRSGLLPAMPGAKKRKPVAKVGGDQTHLVPVRL